MNQGSLNKLVNDFVVQLHSLWQQDVLAALSAAVHGKGDFKIGNAKIGNGRGVKRTPEHLDQVSEQFVEFVAANPGLRIEQINKQLGTTTKDLALPIRKLVAEKKIKVKGQKRSTQYFPGR